MRYPSIYQISTRVLAAGGPVRAAVEDNGDRLRNSGCRHLLILVHGFNNSVTAATNSYNRLVANLDDFFTGSRLAPDAVACLHWPGDVGGMFSIAAYPFDIDRARDSATRVADYLRAFPRANEPGAMQISLIGHSLGCRLVLEMLTRRLPISLAANISVVSLLAPAVPVELLEAAGALALSVAPPRRILKCFSRNDWVLWTAFPIGQEAAFTLGKENELYREAVGYLGNPTSVREAIQTTNGHSQYWSDTALADRFSAAVDPTFYKLPPPRVPMTRELPETVGSDLRGLPNWS